MKELRCVSDETDNPRTSIISHQTEEHQALKIATILFLRDVIFETKCFCDKKLLSFCSQ